MSIRFWKEGYVLKYSEDRDIRDGILINNKVSALFNSKLKTREGYSKANVFKKILIIIKSPILFLDSMFININLISTMVFERIWN